MAVGDPVLYTGYLGSGASVEITFNTRVKITGIYSSRTDNRCYMDMKDQGGTYRFIGYINAFKSGWYGTSNSGTNGIFFFPAGTTIRIRMSNQYFSGSNSIYPSGLYLVTGVEY